MGQAEHDVVSTGPAKGDWRWREGAVDRRHEHLQISFGPLDATTTGPIAAIARSSEHTFVVEFIEGSSEMLAKVREEIDFYLTQWGGADPWAYAIYHCGTAANLYSEVHWHYLPNGQEERG